MESLAVLAAIIGVTVLSSGPLALLASASGFPYVGGLLGVVAMAIGGWWICTVHWEAGLIGWLSVGLGLWAALQAHRHDASQ